jgi:hypothetical protein
MVLVVCEGSAKPESYSSTSLFADILPVAILPGNSRVAKISPVLKLTAVNQIQREKLNIRDLNRHNEKNDEHLSTYQS